MDMRESLWPYCSVLQKVQASLVGVALCIPESKVGNRRFDLLREVSRLADGPLGWFRRESKLATYDLCTQGKVFQER